MANDLVGLLTGISGTQQPMQPIAGTPGFAGMFGAQQAQGLASGLGRIARQGAPSNQERMQEAVSKLDLGSVKGLTTLAKLQQIQGDLTGAAQTVAKVKQLREQVNLSKQQEAQRSSLADFLELEYGDKGGALRTAVMTGAINAGNVDKFIKEEEKEKRTLKNITYTDSEGNSQTQLVLFNDQGDAFDEAGRSLNLPDDAQITITGRTKEDINAGVSRFTNKEFGAVRDDIINSRGKLKVLEGITDESIDTYLSFLGKALAGTGRTLSSFTGLGGDALNDFIEKNTGLDLQEFAGKQGLLFGDLENYFNQKRHDITGAAAAISELRELRKGILSGETSPAVAKAKIAQILQRERDSQEMNFTLLKQNGLDISAYFDKPTTDTENSNQSVSKELPPKSELNAPKMESANRVKTLLSGVDLQKESDR
jgi:hypothetical protein